MKLLLSALVTVFLFSCAHQSQHVAQLPAQPVKRTVANDDRIIKLRVNTAISGFNNESYSDGLAIVYGKEEVQYKNEKFAGYIQMKTPAKTNGTIKPARIFYAKLGNCKVFARYSKSENFCNTPNLHLFNTLTDLQQNKEPVGIIDSWSPGNPTTRYAETTEEYSDLIKAFFNIDTAGAKTNLPYGGVQKSKDL